MRTCELRGSWRYFSVADAGLGALLDKAEALWELAVQLMDGLHVVQLSVQRKVRLEKRKEKHSTRRKDTKKKR